MHQNHSEQSKDDKIAAAKQKLKQFKKESSKSTNHHQRNGSLTPTSQPNYEPTLSERSATPSSSPPPPQQQQQQQQHQIEFPNVTSQAQFKEQLQLHIQTIGILVAEKAELQSKLHQQFKKCDKKQEECDELTGRLKASRQKIADMEKLITQLNHQSNETTRTPLHLVDSSSAVVVVSGLQVEELHNDLNANRLIIDELRMRLTEAEQQVRLKHQESQQMARLTSDLTVKIVLQSGRANHIDPLKVADCLSVRTTCSKKVEI
jgi:hypothetical protein